MLMGMIQESCSYQREGLRGPGISTGLGGAALQPVQALCCKGRKVGRYVQAQGRWEALWWKN